MSPTQMKIFIGADSENRTRNLTLAKSCVTTSTISALVDRWRIELQPSACKADVLPLSLAALKWSEMQDSNLRFPAPKAGDLTGLA